MSNTRFKPILHWDTQGHWLLWGYLGLVMLEKTERDEKAYYKLKYPEFMALLAEGGFPDMEIIWEDEEVDEENFDLYMEDDGNVHERLKGIYEQIIADLPCEVSATESTPECNGENTQPPNRTMKLKSVQQEVVFEAVEHPNITEASYYLEVSDHDKVLVIDGRFFTMTAEEVDKVCRSGLQMSVVVESDDIGEDLVRLITVPINHTGEVPTIDGGQPVPLNENENNDLPNESKTPLTDKFFRVTRKVAYFTVGDDFNDVIEYFTEIDLSYDEYSRLRNATGIKINPDGFVGTLSEPIVVCGHCYPTGTLAIFQGREPGSCFALFSFADGDKAM